MFKDQDKNKGWSSKDKDKDCIVKDKDKDCMVVLKESLRTRTRTRTNITGSDLAEQRCVHCVSKKTRH